MMSGDGDIKGMIPDPIVTVRQHRPFSIQGLLPAAVVSMSFTCRDPKS